MSLNSLPDEIVLDIISHFAQSDSDLATLCRLSRHLHRLARPILYRKIFYDDDKLNNRRLVPLLLRSLLHDRALGGFVQELDISPRSCEIPDLSFNYDDKREIPKVIEEIVNIGYSKQHYGFSATPAINKWTLYRKWWEETVEGRWYAIITIIIFLCPGLRQIHCGEGERYYFPPNYGGENYLEWFFRVVRHSQQAARDGVVRTEPGALPEAQTPRNMAPLLPHLSHGRSVLEPTRGKSSDRGGLELVLFIQTPSVESLHVDSLVQLTPTRFDSLLGLKSLIMEQCVCEASVVGNILRVCLRLEYFSYMHGHPQATISKFDPLLMMEGLLCLTGSLRQLRLARGRPLVLESNSARDSRLSSLADFNVLTHLHLPIEFLVGMAADPHDAKGAADRLVPEPWELVPKSLEHLLISGLETEVILDFAQEEVLELVKRTGSVALYLKSITLVNKNLDETGGRALPPLRETSAANQISLRIS